MSHHSSDAELRDDPLLAEILAAERDMAFFTSDVRGIGESRPNTSGENSLLNPLRVLDWLAVCGHTNIQLMGKGWGALPATFAAVLSDQVKQVTLKNALTSYSEVAESEQYAWPLSALLPGVLGSFDLPDCYRALNRRAGTRLHRQ